MVKGEKQIMVWIGLLISTPTDKLSPLSYNTATKTKTSYATPLIARNHHKTPVHKKCTIYTPGEEDKLCF